MSGSEPKVNAAAAAAEEIAEGSENEAVKSKNDADKSGKVAGFSLLADEPEKEVPTFAPVDTWVPHDEMPEMTTAKKVEYCPVSGMPPDFCEFSDKWEVSKPWVLTNYPQYYPELAGLSISDMQERADKKMEQLDKKKGVKELPGGKKVRSKSPKITVRTAKRQGRKMVTSVIGLETFDIKLEDAAKKFKKKFACGSAACKGQPGQPDSVEIQGDPDQDQLLEILKGLNKDLDVKKVTFVAA